MISEEKRQRIRPVRGMDTQVKTQPPRFTVYTAPSCGPCIGLKAYLLARGIDHEVLDIRRDEVAATWVAAQGYKGTPVTRDNVTGEHWYGFDPIRIEQLISDGPVGVGG